MGDMHLKGALVFLDDVIVFSKTLEHEERLMKVLTRVKEWIEISLEKCLFPDVSPLSGPCTLLKWR